MHRLVVQMVKNLPTMQETQASSLGWEDPIEKGMVTCSSYPGLENSMGRGAWQGTVHGVAVNWTRLKD